MKKITGNLFIRKENESEFQNWDTLPKEKQKEYTEHIDRAAAKACGYSEIKE